MLSLAARGSWRIARASPAARRWMSFCPPEPQPPSLSPARKKVSIARLHKMRARSEPITMLTAYDFPTARALEGAGIDLALVGDSLAQTALGYPSTTCLTLDELLYHVRAVGRGLAASAGGSGGAMMVVDMPFGTYTSTDAALNNAVRLVREGGAEAVKIEGGKEIQDTVGRLTEMGIPVMAHVGLLPQRHTAMSGYRVQGRNADAADLVVENARAMQEAGAFSIVLEAIPDELARYITTQLSIPTIGIGAGCWTDGQVLVWDDMLSVSPGKKAKFVRSFADVGSEVARGIAQYRDTVRARSFPAAEESYSMAPGEWSRFAERHHIVEGTNMAATANADVTTAPDVVQTPRGEIEHARLEERVTFHGVTMEER